MGQLEKRVPFHEKLEQPRGTNHGLFTFITPTSLTVYAVRGLRLLHEVLPADVFIHTCLGHIHDNVWHDNHPERCWERLSFAAV